MRGVLYREWALVAASPATFWQGLLEPALYLVFFLAGISQLAQGGAYIRFGFPGVLALMALAVGQQAGVPVFFDRYTGERETLFSLPVARISLLLGRLVTALARMWAQAAVAAGLGLLLYPSLRGLSWGALSLLIIGSGVMAVMWACVAIWIAGSVRNQAQFNLAINLLVMPVLLTSSAFYPLENLPVWLRWVGTLNPVSHFVAGLRAVASLRSPGWGELAVVAATSVIAFAGACRSYQNAQP